MPCRGDTALIRFAKLLPLTNCLARATLRHVAWQERECAKSRSLQAKGKHPCRMLPGCARGRTGIYGRRTCELVQGSALPATWQNLRQDQTVGGITRLYRSHCETRYTVYYGVKIMLNQNKIISRLIYLAQWNLKSSSCWIVQWPSSNQYMIN